MQPIAPRLPKRLLDVIERLARRSEPIAEINRRVGNEAGRMGLSRPSYEHVRRLVHESRHLHDALPARSEVVVDAVLRRKPPELIVDQLVEPRRRLRDRTPPAK